MNIRDGYRATRVLKLTCADEGIGKALEVNGIQGKQMVEELFPLIITHEKSVLLVQAPARIHKRHTSILCTFSVEPCKRLTNTSATYSKTALLANSSLTWSERSFLSSDRRTQALA